MMHKKLNQSASHTSHKKAHIHDTASTSQRSRLLECLRVQTMATISAHNELNIMMPAARLKELRDHGKVIHRYLITLSGDQGRGRNGIALYFLSTSTTPIQAEI